MLTQTLKCIGLLIALMSCIQAENLFFTMDNGIKDIKKISQKATLLKDLGYDAITWRPGRTAVAVKEMSAKGLKVHAFMMPLQVAPAGKEKAFPLKEIQALKGTGAILWVQMHKKGGNDQDAVRELMRLNQIAEPFGLKIAIYPHVYNYIETLEEALRVAELTNHKNIGVSLTLCHQLKKMGVQDLEPLLTKALPKLFIVQLSGADQGETQKMGWNKLIQPLGEGSYDMTKLFSILKKLNYKGSVGVIGYNIKQPAKKHLKQSITYWKKHQ